MKHLTVLKIKLHAKAMPSYCFVLLFAGIVAWLSYRIVESFLFIISFLVLRYKFDKTYHSNSTLVCLAITCGIILFTVPILLSISVSLLSPIVAGLFIDFMAYHAKNDNDMKKAIEDSSKQCAISLLEMTDAQFVQYCQHKNLQDDEIKIAEICVRQNIKGKEFYQAIGYSEAQAKRKRKAILSKLNK